MYYVDYLFSGWMDYFSEVYFSYLLLTLTISSLNLLLSAAHLWISPQSPWNDSGMGRAFPLFFCPHSAVKVPLIAVFVPLFKTMQEHKFLYKLMQSKYTASDVLLYEVSVHYLFRPSRTPSPILFSSCILRNSCLIG